MFEVSAEPTPITFDDSGVARIAGTRVTLETLIWTFNEGASAEEIAARYPAVSLADVYAVITYYLRHRETVDAYLRDAASGEAAVVAQYGHGQVGLRERLLNRRTSEPK